MCSNMLGITKIRTLSSVGIGSSVGHLGTSSTARAMATRKFIVILIVFFRIIRTISVN